MPETETGKQNAKLGAEDRALLDRVIDEAASPELAQLLRVLKRTDLDEGRVNAVSTLLSKKNFDLGAIEVMRKHAESNILRRLGRYAKQNADMSMEFNKAVRLLNNATYFGDVFATRANADWLREDQFKTAYGALEAVSQHGVDVRWRSHVLMTSAVRANNLKGDFVECGVERGGSATGVINYIGRKAFGNRKFYLFDTFEGLDADLVLEDEAQQFQRSQDKYPNVYDDVVESFKDYDFVNIVRGSVPSTLTHFEPGPVAYLHIDMNAAQPECAAVEFFWPYLEPGAPVLFDDYGFPRFEAQKRELDKLADKLGVAITTLPTGQGMMWKVP